MVAYMPMPGISSSEERWSWSGGNFDVYEWSGVRMQDRRRPCSIIANRTRQRDGDTQNMQTLDEAGNNQMKHQLDIVITIVLKAWERQEDIMKLLVAEIQVRALSSWAQQL